MSLLVDPVEGTDAYLAVVEDVDRQAHAVATESLARHGGSPSEPGFCHLFWMHKQWILAADHGIEWRSPSDMNPNVLFD